jgi:TIR domain/AAA ATPase domain/WD domain, G-beta repeat
MVNDLVVAPAAVYGHLETCQDVYPKRFPGPIAKVVSSIALRDMRTRKGVMGEIFISYASADARLASRVAEGVRQAGHRIFLDSDREDGIAPGAAWQKTLFRELRLCDAVVFLNSSASQASMWCHSELVVAIELGKRVYSLDLAPGLAPHPLLQSLQGIRLETTLDAGIQRLTGNLGLDGLAQGSRLRWERGRSPYPGLAAMDVADAGVFFGREEEVRSLVARVDGPLGQSGGNLVVVVGPSGAGKSSLVRAGLVARLAMPRSGWVVAGPFEPGTRPLGRLASRLAALLPGQLTESECRGRLLNEGVEALGEWLADHVEFGGKRLLVTVDQAEQLATVTPLQEAAEFLAVLGGGLGAGSPVTVVMTVRSDRFDEIQQLPVVGPMIHAPFVIAPMGRSQLAAVIEGPAGRADLNIEAGLVGHLIDDAVRGSSGEAADALPFLAFTLREMYDLAMQEDRGAFTAADYERVGRIEGAIIRRTEAAESLLPSDSGPVLEHLLPRFVTLSEDRLPAGRPVPREGLTTAEQAITETLENQRLLTGTGDTVRLAHEQLITAWPRLAQTVADRRDDLLLQARLERQANDWKHGHGELLGRDATATASSWLAQRAEAGTDRSAIGDYIRASGGALRRRRARLVGLLSTVVVLALVATVVAVVAGILGSDAVDQSHTAQSEEMAAEATNLFSANAPLAMLLSVQAYERAQTLQARSALLEAAEQSLGDILSEGAPVDSLAFSPVGRILAVGGNSDVALWNIGSGRRTASLSEGGPVDSLAFSPVGRILAVGGNSDVALWNIGSGRRTASLSEGGPVDSLAFSPVGRILAGGGNSDVALWNIGSGRRTASLSEGSPADSLAFSPDGRTLAVGYNSGDVGLWDTGSGQQTATLFNGSTDGSPVPSVNSVAFSPDGRTVAVGDSAGDVGLWDTATGQRTATLAEGSPVNSVAFSRDGRTLAVGDLNGNVALLRRSLLNLTGSFLSRLICGEVRRNMTQAQWTANAPGQAYEKTCPAYS